MIPISRFGKDGQQGLMYDAFVATLGAICRQHQEERRAIAFAFILHGSTDPHVARVLEDPGYWSALDAISGNALSVFAIFDRELPEAAWNLHDVRMDARDLDRSNQRMVSQHFREGIRPPALIFFTVD